MAIDTYSPLAQAVLADAPPEELARIDVPETYLAAHLHRDDVRLFDPRPHGHDGVDKDVRRSIRFGPVPTPELAPDEVLVAVMASAINFNTVWSAMFEPVPGFVFLERMRRLGPWGARHDLPHHVLGSDCAGVVVRVGRAVQRWKIGDRVVLQSGVGDTEDPSAHGDEMTSADLRAWGFETNFGALAELTVAKANQLLRKPGHLTWEEAACNLLCAATAYRMLVGPHGARMKQGDVVLVWGATGGLGSYAVQLVRGGGGIPVGVVGTPERAALLRRVGCEAVVLRSELGPLTEERGWRRLGEAIRRQVGEDPHVVFEHTGRETFAASVYVARRGGSVVTCGSSTGYAHHFDNRHLWMKVKRIIGSHGANYAEFAEVNRLIALGRVHPTLSRVYPLEQTGEAARAVQCNAHVGKVGVLALAPEEGLGVEDPELRARVGEAALRAWRPT